MYIADIHAVGNEVVQISIIMSLMIISSKMIILYSISTTLPLFSGLDLLSKMSKPVKKTQTNKQNHKKRNKNQANKQTNKRHDSFQQHYLDTKRN